MTICEKTAKGHSAIHPITAWPLDGVPASLGRTVVRKDGSKREGAHPRSVKGVWLGQAKWHIRGQSSFGADSKASIWFCVTVSQLQGAVSARDSIAHRIKDHIQVATREALREGSEWAH